MVKEDIGVRKVVGGTHPLYALSESQFAGCTGAVPRDNLIDQAV
jgi:hypothetical protein